MNKIEQNVAKKSPKKYHCTYCDYYTFNKYDFDKHKMTRKHIKNSKIEQIEQKSSKKSQQHVCRGCGKEYKSRTGLWYHEKKCTTSVTDEENKTETIHKLDNVSDLESLNKTDLVKMMGEALKQMKKQSDVISELVPKVGNNNNNTQFNLNIFLNEDCKDAIDWTDFVKSIELEVNDLKTLKDSNITTSISNAICSKIHELGVYKRPIHCYDLKRKKLCIKSDNDWEKEEDKVDKLLEKGEVKMQHKYLTLVEKWEKDHPNWTDSEKEEYLKLQQKIYEDVDKKKSKMNLVKEVNIPKN